MSTSQILITPRLLNPPLQNTALLPPPTTPAVVVESSNETSGGGASLLSGVENIRFDDGSRNWTTKEKIFLVAGVLIYGDSSWSLVSEQLRRFMQLTSTADDVLTINENKLSKSLPVNQFKRSVYECSSLYKQMMRRYASQIGVSDPKKLYEILVKERIAELNTLTLMNRRQYADLAREIQQIMTSDTKNFEQLKEAWSRIKKNELKFIENAEKKPVAEKIDLDLLSSSIIKNRDDLDDGAIEKNLETIVKLSELQAKIKAKAARIELAQQQQRLQQQLLEQQQQQQLMQKQLQQQKEQMAQKELEQQQQQQSSTSSLSTQPPVPAKVNLLLTPEKSNPGKKQSPSVNYPLGRSNDLSITMKDASPETSMKTRSLRSVTSSNSLQGSQDKKAASASGGGGGGEQDTPTKTRQTIKQEIKEEKMDREEKTAFNEEETRDNEDDDDDKFSSDDDVPLVEIQKQTKSKSEAKNSSSKMDSGSENSNSSTNQASSAIEWKPIVDSSSSSKKEDGKAVKTRGKQPDSEAENDDEDGDDDGESTKAEGEKKRAGRHKKATPKKIFRALDSSASSSISSSSAPSPSPSVSSVGSSSAVSAAGSAHSSSGEEESVVTLVEKKPGRKSAEAAKAGKSNNKANEPSKPIATRHSLRSDSFNRGSRKQDQQSEVIFTPLIRDDDDAKAKTAAATASSGRRKAKKRTREEMMDFDEEEPNLDHDSDDVGTNNGDDFDEDDSASSVKKYEETGGDKDDESQSTRSSLRNKDNSKSRKLSNTPASAPQSQMKRRSGAVSRTPVPSARTPAAAGKGGRLDKTKLSPSAAGAAASSREQKSPGQFGSVGRPSLSNTTGLVSIIKSEPVQISATSTILESGHATKRTSSQSANDMDDNAMQSSSSSVSSSSIKFEDEKAYRAWKKSILMVYNNIACHKHATVFMQPVREEIAPGYRNIVHRPMDLSTIKRNIENGSIKSTREFQRDVMLMFTNAIMYNSSSHDIHKISLEMYKEVLNDVEQLLNAQEAMGEDSKPLRFKEIRSSTASDRGVNLGTKDEALETGSMRSSSSVSIPVRTSSMRKSSKNDIKAAAAAAAAETTPAPTVSKKRRQSGDSPAKLDTSTKEKPGPGKGVKRRKSGR